MGDTVREVLARLSDAECRDIAELAIAASLAEDVSLSDLTHRAHVYGVLRGAAPTFANRLTELLTLTRSIRVREPVRFRARRYGA